mgnify:CR=1 FL=1
MTRRVLLLEPNYRNKYPPLNLMKLATYYRQICGDDVRFFKGDLRDLAAQLLLEEFFESDAAPVEINLFADDSPPAETFAPFASSLLDFIKTGKNSIFDGIPNLRDTQCEMNLRYLHSRFKNKNFPKFDVICVATLFTFEWAKTVSTINSAKNFLSRGGKIHVGGVAATLVPDAIFAETGIRPHIGLLDNPNDLDATNHAIIDTLPLDYSILDEIDYEYPAADAYFGYTTRGCIRKCSFCAVTTLEPVYKNFVSIASQIAAVEQNFGAKKNLLLLDNNVLASDRFNDVIDEIKSCGFAKGANFTPPNEYAVAVKNLRAGFNDRACIKKIFRLYDKIASRLPDKIAATFNAQRAKIFTKADILAFDETAAPLFEKYLKRTECARYVDFNQGLDARLLTAEKMARLAEINIRPMRIAFDHIEQRDIYERAIRLAASYGIRDLSNYILYNFEDAPDDLYARLKINVELCEELNVSIYSFPMKFHPITDPNYFRNRHYIGRRWNRKFIRAVQAILNATGGKVGRGKNFFEAAFGKNLDEFHDLLWMPEALIIHREKYSGTVTENWRQIFHALTPAELAEAQNIIAKNSFSDADISAASFPAVRNVLKFYQITRDKN